MMAIRVCGISVTLRLMRFIRAVFVSLMLSVGEVIVGHAEHHVPHH